MGARNMFQPRQCVHLKLTSEMHLAVRMTLLKYNITMQDFFDELIGTVMKNPERVAKVASRVARKKLQAKLDGLKKTKPIVEEFSDYDKEAIYSLLESPSDEKEAEEIHGE